MQSFDDSAKDDILLCKNSRSLFETDMSPHAVPQVHGMGLKLVGVQLVQVDT